MSQQPHQISFACPSCQTVLQVPLQMAGVTGPCPRCTTPITAPFPQQTKHQQQAPAQPPQQTNHQQQAPAQPPQQTNYQQQAPAQYNPSPQVQNQAPQQPAEAPAQRIKHDPNAYRKPSDPTPDIAPLEQAAKPANGVDPTGNRSCFTRVFFPLVFLSFIAFTITAILMASGLIPVPFLSNDESSLSEVPPTDEFDRPEEPVKPVELAPEPVAPSDTQNATRPEDTQVNGATPPPPNLDDIVSDNPNDSQNPSYESISRFFEATTLEERKKYFTFSNYTEAEIESSLLAGEVPIPQNSRLVSDFDNEKTKGLIAYYGILASPTPAAPTNHYIVQLHRKSIEMPYKVNADALLDLYSPQLTQFSEDSKAPGIHVHVILDAHRLNLNEKIPNYKDWGYVKIRTFPGHEEVLRAYFKLNSSMAESIEKPRGPQWSNPTPARVRLSWNNSDPANPFIELLKIDHFSWKP